MSKLRSNLFALPLLAFPLLAVPSLAAAQDGPRVYVNLGIEAVELNDFDNNGTIFIVEAAENIVLRGGVVLNDYFAIEGEGALGIGNADDDGIADYESRFAGYGRLRYPFLDNSLEVFGRLGFATTDISSRNAIDPGAQTGVTYGGGLAFNFGNRREFQIRADLTRYEFGNNQDAGSLALSLGYNF